jgi:mannose/fructose/N-acetylgalactosamine-specific phosphotransferase system component IID
LCTRLCLRSKILQIKWDYKRYDAITCIYNMSYVFISIYIHIDGLEDLWESSFQSGHNILEIRMSSKCSSLLVD